MLATSACSAPQRSLDRLFPTRSTAATAPALPYLGNCSLQSSVPGVVRFALRGGILELGST